MNGSINAKNFNTALVIGIHKKELAFGCRVAEALPRAGIRIVRIDQGLPQEESFNGRGYYYSAFHREIYLQLHQQVKTEIRLLIDLHTGINESGRCADIYCSDHHLLVKLKKSLNDSKVNLACPCATILSASTAISAAINAAAKRNILIKGGRYLEEAAEANVICFDKTGTLTTNKPEISHLAALNRTGEEELIPLAYSAELHNSHPVALSIKAEAQKRGIKAVRHDLCDYMPGIGVRCEIKGDEIFVGSGKLMNKFSVAPVEVKKTA
jgi:hypothetical protein